MSTKINLTYFGMEGQGSTVKEAKLDAGHKIEAALSGYHFPTIITKTVEEVTYTVFVFRMLNQWGYSYIKHGAEKDGRKFSSANDNTEDEALRHAWRHIAGNEFTFSKDGREWLESNDKDGLRDCKSIALWQHQYKAWRNVGKDDNEARNLCYQWPPDYTPTYVG